MKSLQSVLVVLPPALLLAMLGSVSAGEQPKNIDALPPLPELEEIEAPEHEPGASLRPAVFLTFEERTRKEVVAAYAKMWKKHAGSYQVLIPVAEGWRNVLQNQETKARKLACSIDVVEAIQLEDDMAAAVKSLRAGCAELARELKASAKGRIDAKAVRSLAVELQALRKKAGTSVNVSVVAGEKGYRAADGHRIARALGFGRSDFGSYAWYNESDIGYDILISLRPDDKPYRFDFKDPNKTYSSLGLGSDLDQVPVPHIVMDRLLTTAATFVKHLGGHLADKNGKRIAPAALKARASKAIATLRPKGLLVPARVAKEPAPAR
jgi:hypothetical protein